MATGDVTLVDHGVHTVSGNALTAAVLAIGNLTGNPLSGAALHFEYVGEGQINLLEVQTAT